MRAEMYNFEIESSVSGIVNSVRGSQLPAGILRFHGPGDQRRSAVPEGGRQLVHGPIAQHDRASGLRNRQLRYAVPVSACLTGNIPPPAGYPAGPGRNPSVGR